MLNEYFHSIILEKINKINEESKMILKLSFPLCKSEDPKTATASQLINREAYAIKCLTEQISGFLRK